MRQQKFDACNGLFWYTMFFMVYVTLLGVQLNTKVANNIEGGL
eukprot:SAG11_NODE_35347_length_267_cov_0.601190_2_plen_42_part_01